MKLASFKNDDGLSWGVVRGDGVVDLGRRSGKRCPTLRDAIAGDALSGFSELARESAVDHALALIELMPPIIDPGKIICVGRNYKAHAAEGNNKLPTYPMLFVRLCNTLVAHNQPLVRPKVSTAFDYEGELAVIIGKPGRHIAKADVPEHIAGYACFNDGSIRDYQFDHGLTTGKNFVGTGGFGPYLVTSDEIPDATKLILKTRLNGQQVQSSGVDQLIFDIPTLINYISAFTPLEAGDVIVTGTPEGVGFARKPPLWMKPGDVVEVDISGVGVLRNPVVAED